VNGKEITIEIKRPEIIVLLGILTVVLVFELQVTFNSPIVFGDEGFHTRMAQFISQNREYPVWQPYEGTKLIKYSFSRPPLWNFLEGSFFFIFGFNEILVKSLTPFIAILVGLGVFLLGKKIYGKEVGFIAALITITIPSFVTYSVLFYTDTLFVFYFTLFVLAFFLAIKTEEKKYWILSGIFGALSFLTKTPGFAVFPLIALGFLYQVYKKEKIVSLFKNYLILGLFLIFIISPFFVRNYVYYRTPSCALPILDTSGCMVTFDYKSTKEIPGQLEQVGTAMGIFQMGLTNYLNFSYGIFWFVPLVFICGLITIFYKKERTNILILLGILSFIPIFYLSFKGRAEDMARMMLGLSGIIGLTCGIYLKEVYEIIKKYYKQLALVVFIFVIFLSFLNFNEKLNMMKQVKQFSPTFLQACDFVKRNVSEDALLMTIWGHQSSYNCQRNIAGFDFPDTGDIVLSENLTLALSRLKAHGITHIFIQKFSISSTPIGEKYPISFIQFLENNPDTFVKIYENGLPLQQCLQAGGCDGNILYEINYTKIQ
jgi:hypothetical protein